MKKAVKPPHAKRSTIRIETVILAAGKGKRMYSQRPKVLHELAGRALLHHVTDTARALGAAKVVVVYGHGGRLVPDTFNDSALTWCEQKPQLGTGHALKQAIPHLDAGAVALVLYGDVPLIRAETCCKLLSAARNNGLALLTAEFPDPTGYGRVVRDSQGKVCGIVEDKDATAQQHGIREVNTGIMAAPVALFARWVNRLSRNNRQREYYLTDVVALAAAEGVEVSAHQPESLWEVQGVNSNTQLAELERRFQTECASHLLEAGVTLLDPQRLDVRGELICGQDVVIDVGCVFEGKVELGDRVRVGAYCVVRDTRIAADTRIAPFSVIDQAAVGAECQIGPFSRIRPGTVLERSAHIGNFVEIKNSHIDRASKINHLSYVGDSTVGKNVNIGAGTITCNYDGKNKHETHIGDNVKIGSDTMLVAPITVGDGASTGAGSVVTKDVEENTLVVGVPAQTIKSVDKK
ncbi:MAG: bifunctional UDP-N-acetylglucosamine diphosphorylase/glucosamine-1-phosphate N-acetyltransferase GlmU [Burkholderiales bacterium]